MMSQTRKKRTATRSTMHTTLSWRCCCRRPSFVGSANPKDPLSCIGKELLNQNCKCHLGYKDCCIESDKVDFLSYETMRLRDYEGRKGVDCGIPDEIIAEDIVGCMQLNHFWTVSEPY